jgi:hypothetical protein
MKAKITIDGADAAGANYITWAPVHSSIGLIEADAGAGPIDVLLRNQNPSQGGQVVFRDVITGARQDTLQLHLQADGTPVDFFVAGKFGHPSVNDEDTVIEAVDANTGDALSTKALMVRIRKNANTLTGEERDRFLEAFGELNGKGTGIFRDFRDMHTNDSDFEAHRNFGFLPWHRAYLLDLERELQQIDPSVTLPYWKFDAPAENLFTREFPGSAEWRRKGPIRARTSSRILGDGWRRGGYPENSAVRHGDLAGQPASPIRPPERRSCHHATRGPVRRLQGNGGQPSRERPRKFHRLYPRYPHSRETLCFSCCTATWIACGPNGSG